MRARQLVLNLLPADAARLLAEAKAGLAREDFARVATQKKAVLVGMTAQTLLVPLLGLGVAWAFRLEPKLAILDETDSGLDIDALRIVANGVNKLKNENNAVIVVTHYQRLLDYIVPDYVHVMYDGRIVKSGDKSLALELEAKGYDWVKKEFAAATA